MFYRGLFNLLWFEDFGWKTCWIDGCLKGNQHRFLFTNTHFATDLLKLSVRQEIFSIHPFAPPKYKEPTFGVNRFSIF